MQQPGKHSDEKAVPGLSEALKFGYHTLVKKKKKNTRLNKHDLMC